MEILVSSYKHGATKEKFIKSVSQDGFTWTEIERLAVRFKDIAFAISVAEKAWKSQVRIYLGNQKFTIKKDKRNLKVS